jgi:hypothetical protein
VVTPEQRKLKSEARLKELGLPVNPNLPLIEAESEVSLRSSEEILQRLIALWAVSGTAFLPRNRYFRDYVVAQKCDSWLSKEEKLFLFRDAPSDKQLIQFTWRQECVFFLGWAAGLIGAIEIPSVESKCGSMMDLFPGELEDPHRLRAAIHLRSKQEILDWADLLYRLHWATRQFGASLAPRLNPGVVQEWHLAVNWLTRYEDEDNWDWVGTDT